MMIVPDAANMPPTPWQTEILASGIWAEAVQRIWRRSEEHTSELQSHLNLVCRLLLEKKKKITSISLRMPVLGSCPRARSRPPPIAPNRTPSITTHVKLHDRPHASKERPQHRLQQVSD